jgi:hypothetical protein
MYRISFFALVVAFLAELGVDILMQGILFRIFAGDALQLDMADAAVQQLYETVSATPGYTLASLLLGTGTTVGGGYLAARMARQYPYYHGLGMGLIGMAFTLYLWRTSPLWLSLFAFFSNVPLCIWGAHLAKRHMPPPD